MAKSPKTPAGRGSQYEQRFDLGALLEFSASINATHDLPAILSHFLLTIMGKLLCARGMVLLEERTGVYRTEVCKGCGSTSLPHDFEIPKLPSGLTYITPPNRRRQPWLAPLGEMGMHCVVPLQVREHSIGVAVFGLPQRKARLSRIEETYVRSMSSIAAAAIEKAKMIDELRDLNRQLDGKIQELNTLFDLSKEFNALLDTERILKLLTYSVLGQIGAPRFVVCMRNGDYLEPVISRLEKPLPRDTSPYLLEIKEPYRVNALPPDIRSNIGAVLEDLEVEVVVPLVIHGVTRGLIGVGKRISAIPYTSLDLEFLSSVGNLAIISLENARLFSETLEKQRLEDELMIAREIQQGLLPSELPSIAHFEVAATNVPSKQVGGDYYDIISLGNGRYVLAIGDVSGKGTPASLLMANLQALIRGLVPLGLPIETLTARVNDLVTDNAGSGRFITFFWGILDAERRTLSYVNAGHNPPMLLRRDRSMERLEDGGLVLGVMKTTTPYEFGEVTFEQGDLLVMFTDGVSEAMNAKGEEFGEEALAMIIKASREEQPEVVLQKIVEGVQRHSSGTHQSDDITLLVLQCGEEAANGLRGLTK